MKRLFALVLTFALMLCLVSCGGNDEFPKISSSKVEKITSSFRALSPYGELDEDDVKTFIKLYNKSEYAGEGSLDVGETTPDYGAFVYFEDGSHLSVIECIAKDRDFEVRLYDADGKEVAWFYLVNEELTTFFIEPMMESGQYYAEGDYEKNETPYVHLDVEHNIFSFSHGTIFSAALNGKYEIVGDKLIATLSDDKTVEFEIADGKTLVLANGDIGIGNQKMSVGTRFKFSKELK